MNRKPLYDLAVIGAGTAGMAAAVFAAKQGMSVVQIGHTANLAFAAGLLDLMGRPLPENAPETASSGDGDPFELIARLRNLPPDHPFSRHPYTRLKDEDIRTSLLAYADFLARAGYPCVFPHNNENHRNRRIITPVGTVKSTWAAPLTMAAAEDAIRQTAPCLLVDFHGLKGFSARQIAETLKSADPGRQTGHERIAFPGPEREWHPEAMARTLESGWDKKVEGHPSGALKELIARLGPVVDAFRTSCESPLFLGLPAVLGHERAVDIHACLETALGCRIFEIPTLLPALTGLRLKTALEQAVPRMGVTALYGRTVSRILPETPSQLFPLILDNDAEDQAIRARTVILATGRFSGRGLHAERSGIRESLMDLPVEQPADRADWHRRKLLDPAGHPVNRSGIPVDDRFRPVDSAGNPVRNGVFIAGSILAGQDWMRQQCGSGLGIATAGAAVRGAVQYLDDLSPKKAPGEAGKPVHANEEAEHPAVLGEASYE